MTQNVEFLDSLADGYSACGHPGPEKGLLLAVSGGADSMALLHGTSQLWTDDLGRIVVAHVDHQLRGDRSRQDTEFVETAADSLGLKFRLLTANVQTEQQACGGSTEEVARQVRYQLLRNTASRLKLGSVVCGHHQDDQAETVLHNILRGTGLRGLAGMSGNRSLGEGVRLIRPLLNIKQASAENFLRGQQLTWRIDESNASSAFTRNRIRNNLMPLLAEEYNPQFVNSLLRLAGHARDAEDLSGLVAERCLDDVVLELQPGVCRLNRTRLVLWPEPVVRATLRLIWNRQSWPQQAMTQSHWAELATHLVNATEIPRHLPGVVIGATSSMVRLFKAP